MTMGFPRQEYWSGLPVPSPRDLLNPGIKPASPALVGGFFTTEPPENAKATHKRNSKSSEETFHHLSLEKWRLKLL